MATALAAEPRRRVAIVDDNPEHRMMLGQKAKLSGLEPVMFDDRYNSVEDLLKYVATSNVYAVLCDHRLREGNYANFDGAEAVAALYDVPKPAILVTDYGSVDINGSIRAFRRRIPVLLPTGEVRRERILRGLEACEQEVVMKEIPLTRIPRRSLMLIDDIVGVGDNRQVIVFVPQWNPNEAVGLPESLIPMSIRSELRKDRFLVAMINIDAERSEDLFFDDVQLPPS